MATVYLATVLVILAEYASSKEQLKYLGCYHMGLVGERADGHPKLVPCLDLCRESGNEFAAYRIPYNCHCVYNITFTAMDDNKCSFRCQEDDTWSCGGTFTVSFYSTTYTNHSHSDLTAVNHYRSNVPVVLFIGVITFFVSISTLIISLAFCRSRRVTEIEHQVLY